MIHSHSADVGCSIVYGGHGGALVPLVNAVVAHPKLTWVYARNEHDAATMAAAHAKLTGGLGCVIATSGPGATNLTTGLIEALLDRVPLLAITGLKPTAVMGYSEFQDVNQSRLFAGAGLEWSKDAASPDAVLPLLRDAVTTALTRSTCAHLAIPVDIQASPSPLPLRHFCASHSHLSIAPPRVDPKYIDEAASTLVGNPKDNQPRNVIAVGLRAVYFPGIGQAILDLAEALNAPVVTRLHAKGVVDESHPLSFGVIGVHGKPGLEASANLIQSADRVLSIGVEDETLLLCNTAGLQIRELIEVQPNSIIFGTRYNARHRIVGDLVEACRSLTERVEVLMHRVSKKRSWLNNEVEIGDNSTGQDPPVPKYSPGNGSRCKSETEERNDKLWADLHKANWKALVAMQTDIFGFECDDKTLRDGYCHPAKVLSALSECRTDENFDEATRNAAVSVDVGDVTLWASLCLRLEEGSRVLYSEHLGTMGYALCAGVASVLARPAPSTGVVISGDAGFQMSLQELATFQQMKRPGDKLLCIVFDNQVMGRVAFGFDSAAGCDTIGPDYVALSKAYGGDGLVLSNNTKAKEVMQKALNTDGLFILHVIVDPEVKADMATFKDKALAVMNSG